MQTFEVGRATVGAQALGIARAAYEYALEYAKQRPPDRGESGRGLRASWTGRTGYTREYPL